MTPADDPPSDGGALPALRKKGGRPRAHRTKVCFSLSARAIEILNEMDDARGGNTKGLIIEEALRFKHRLDVASEELAKHLDPNHPMAALLTANLPSATPSSGALTSKPLTALEAQMKDRLSK